MKIDIIPFINKICNDAELASQRDKPKLYLTFELYEELMESMKKLGGGNVFKATNGMKFIIKRGYSNRVEFHSIIDIESKIRNRGESG